MSLSTCLPEPIRTYLLPHFPLTCNFIFLCLLQHFLPMWICRSKYTQIRNWFFNITFIAVLQPFVVRQTTENVALWNTHSDMKQIKRMWFRQGSYKTVLESAALSDVRGCWLQFILSFWLVFHVIRINSFNLHPPHYSTLVCCLCGALFFKYVSSKLFGSIHLALRNLPLYFVVSHTSWTIGTYRRIEPLLSLPILLNFP